MKPAYMLLRSNQELSERACMPRIVHMPGTVTIIGEGATL